MRIENGRKIVSTPQFFELSSDRSFVVIQRTENGSAKTGEAIFEQKILLIVSDLVKGGHQSAPCLRHCSSKSSGKRNRATGQGATIFSRAGSLAAETALRNRSDGPLRKPTFKTA